MGAVCLLGEGEGHDLTDASERSLAIAASDKHAMSCPPLCPILECSPQAPLSMRFSSKNTGVDGHALLQGSSNPGVKPVCPALQVGSLLLSHPESPKHVMLAFIAT